MFYLLPYILGGLAIIIVFACLGYHTYMAVKYNNGLNIRNRQANTLAEETARDNRFNEIFFIEPNSAEAARIRAQLEKDDKDLPSYDEVMRMTNLATPTAAPATNSAFVPAISASSHSIAALQYKRQYDRYNTNSAAIHRNRC
ncbi:hypothetical protein DOY81_014185 [Sarcophaga bullata]|nr:hypothetical protein DOY81_014185 [Sarcophaga bullata]